MQLSQYLREIQSSLPPTLKKKRNGKSITHFKTAATRKRKAN